MSWCDVLVRVTPTASEIAAMSDRTALDIDHNNLVGASLGCWGYP